MTDRFAKANLRTISSDAYDYIVTVKVANGDYHELGAIDPYHADTKLQEFARTNRLILTECAGFSKRSRAVTSDSGDFAGRVVSPIAATRFSAQSRRHN